MQTQPSLRERYQGAMVGVLCGDALGAPYETWDATRIKADFEKRGGLVPFDYENPWKDQFPNLMGKTFPAGRPTDDSDHTAALAESLVAKRGVDQEDIFNRLRHVVYDHVSPLWEGKAVGAGQTTRKVLKPTTWAESKALDMSDAYPSNGSLMRSVPLALFFGVLGPNLDATRLMSEVTHRLPLTSACCYGYINFLCALLGGEDFEGAVFLSTSALSHNWRTDEGFRVIKLIEECGATPRDPEKWPGRGDVMLSFHASLWAMHITSNFRDGITRAVGIGGDTDTYGAIAGGLLGAYYGINAIPEEWQVVLKGRDKMVQLADKFYDIANS
jgi:ADP-ribosyl-[dinitrogen reductase] hydrolase